MSAPTIELTKEAPRPASPGVGRSSSPGRGSLRPVRPSQSGDPVPGPHGGAAAVGGDRQGLRRRIGLAPRRAFADRGPAGAAAHDRDGGRSWPSSTRCSARSSPTSSRGTASGAARALSTVVDIPFAIPTLVTGVMLRALYGPNSPVGAFLQEPRRQGHLRAARHPGGAAVRDPAAGRANRAADHAGARPRGGGGVAGPGRRAAGSRSGGSCCRTCGRASWPARCSPSPGLWVSSARS